MRKSFIALTFLLVPACLSAQLGGKIYLQRADSLLEQVLSLYEVKKYGLMMFLLKQSMKLQKMIIMKWFGQMILMKIN